MLFDPPSLLRLNQKSIKITRLAQSHRKASLNDSTSELGLPQFPHQPSRNQILRTQDHLQRMEKCLPSQLTYLNETNKIQRSCSELLHPKLQLASSCRTLPNLKIVNDFVAANVSERGIRIKVSQSKEESIYSEPSQVKLSKFQDSTCSRNPYYQNDAMRRIMRARKDRLTVPRRDPPDGFLDRFDSVRSF
jgi:hypothetical protein